jgi:16S rRNA (uracil1498-N3)-methyltransferase
MAPSRTSPLGDPSGGAPDEAHTAAHVFVDDIDNPALDPADRHHLERVLRLRPGERVTVSDGAGCWCVCEFGLVLEPVGEVVVEPEPEPPITVAFAVPKGDRPEWAVQKLTEVGVDHIVLLHTDRSVVRWEGERAERQRERLERVAREASMQSRRRWLPEVDGPLAFEEVADWPGAALCVPGGDPPDLDRPVALIGPEGGWSPSEHAASHGSLGLGSTVLRVETAAVVAGTLLVALRTGLVGPAPSALDSTVGG